MKLNIKNYYKIIGRALHGEWILSDVTETDDWYRFVCRRASTQVTFDVRIKRDPMWKPKAAIWRYEYWHIPGNGQTQFPASAFSTMDKVINIISTDLKNAFNNAI